MPAISDIEEQEVRIKINTDSQDTFETPNLSGKLDCLIIESNQKCQIILESELGYLIFHRHNFEGVEYIAPRVRAVSQLSDKVGLQDIPNMEEFNINEKLIFTIIGPKNTEVNIILRFG